MRQTARIKWKLTRYMAEHIKDDWNLLEMYVEHFGGPIADHGVNEDGEDSVDVALPVMFNEVIAEARLAAMGEKVGIKWRGRYLKNGRWYGRWSNKT